MRCKFCGQWSGFFQDEHLACSQAGKAVTPQTAPKNGGIHIESWPLFLLCSAVVTITPFSRINEIAKLFLIFGSIALYGVILAKRQSLHRFVVNQALEGNYKWALAVDRVLFLIRAYPEPLAGWIYMEAGRYEEGRTFFQTRAFDSEGQPRTKSFEMLCYALILTTQENYADAELLLELAADVAKEPGDIHIALADCLLAQKKDASRALDLTTKVLEFRDKVTTKRPLAQATAAAMHAFALAACGLRKESRYYLDQVLKESTTFSKRNSAGLYIVAGFTRRALGSPEDAHKAFQTALTLHPFGDIAFRARREIAR